MSRLKQTRANRQTRVCAIASNRIKGEQSQGALPSHQIPSDCHYSIIGEYDTVKIVQKS